MTRCCSLYSVVLAAGLAAILPGCHDGPTLYTVRGEVSHQGQTVAQGEIIFADSEGEGPTARGVIDQGQYTIQTTEGRKVVRITATRATGKMIEGAMGATYPEVVDLIPKQYNSETTLQATVDTDGPLVIDFHLQ